MRMYGRDVFLEPRKLSQTRAVIDRSQTLRYRSVEFGAVAHIPRRITKVCNSGSTSRRVIVVGSM